MGKSHMLLERVDGWEGRLAAFIASRQERPFDWRANCCAGFAIAAVAVVTGVQVWPITWRTPCEAGRVIAKAGGLRPATTSVLGPPTNDWRRLRRADVALVVTAGRPSLAICTGQSLAAPGFERLEHLPLSVAQEVWRIG